MQEIEMKTVRASSLELYRIIMMLFIVAHHAVMNSACMSRIDVIGGGINDFILLAMGAWGKVGINCFVLITGYFMCEKAISIKKFLKLYFEVIFYKIVFNLFFIAKGSMALSPILLIDTFFPFRYIADGFTSAFLVFFVCIPFLNVLVRNMTRRQHQLLIVLTVGVFSLLASLPKFTVVFNYVEWFCVLYFISSYLKLHKADWMENCRLWGWMSLLALVTGIGSVFLDAYVLPKYLGTKINAYLWLMDSNRITALLPALCFFLYFKNLRTPYSKLVNTIASTTFGVLLIHANSAVMQDWLFKDICHCSSWAGSWSGLLMGVATIVAVFAACSVSDYVRQYLLEKPLFKWMDKRWKLP